MLSGCGGPNAQVRRIQGEKDELLAVIDKQRDANRALQLEMASLEQRLDEAETTLAGGKPRSQLSRSVNSTPAASPGSQPKSTSSQSNPASDALPWRPHRAASQTPGTLPLIAQISRQDDRVQIDPETGAGVWNESIGFEKNSAALTPESRKHLDALSKLLGRSPASKLRVLVATSAERIGSRTQESSARSGRDLAAARGKTVADYLDRHGIAEDRLATASTGSRKSPRDEHGNPTAATDDVRIYLVDPDQPLLGWLKPEGTLKR